MVCCSYVGQNAKKLLKLPVQPELLEAPNEYADCVILPCQGEEVDWINLKAAASLTVYMGHSGLIVLSG